MISCSTPSSVQRFIQQYIFEIILSIYDKLWILQIQYSIVWMLLNVFNQPSLDRHWVFVFIFVIIILPGKHNVILAQFLKFAMLISTAKLVKLPSSNNMRMFSTAFQHTFNAVLITISFIMTFYLFYIYDPFLFPLI